MPKSRFSNCATYFLALSIFLFFNFSNEIQLPKQKQVIGPIPAVNERLLISTTDHDPAITRIEYNLDKSPVKFVCGTVTVYITYSQDLVIQTWTRDAKKIEEDSYILSDGVARRLSSKFFDHEGGLVNERVTDYRYSNGKLVEEEYNNNGLADGRTTYFYNLEGDLEQMESFKSSTLTSKGFFTYYRILDKSGSYGQFDCCMAGTLFPRKSRYLVKSLTVQKTGNTIVYKHSHHLDSQGYVVKESVTRDGVPASKWINVWQ